MRRKRLIIISAGSFARELLVWARDIPLSQRDWEPVGFLDPNPKALDSYPCDLPILGDETNYDISEDEVFACALSDPKIKLRVCRIMQQKGARFISIVHPTAILGPHCQLGIGCVVCPNVVVTNNVRLGDFVMLNIGVGVGHDAVIGDGCTVSPGALIAGKTILEEGVFVGSLAAILDRQRVGRYARIGSGSVVVSRVPQNWTVMGVPARRLRLPDE